MSERPELMTFQQALDLNARLDRLIGLLGEEINLHPDSVYPTAISEPLRIGSNMAVLPSVTWQVIDRTSGRWLMMTLRDMNGYPVLIREWRCVWRSADGSMVIDRPQST